NPLSWLVAFADDDGPVWNVACEFWACMECANPNAIAIATANIKVTRFIVSPLLLVFLSDRPIVSFRQACGVSLVRRYLRPEVTTPTRFYPEDRAARLFLPCSIRLISSLDNFSGS